MNYEQVIRDAIKAIGQSNSMYHKNRQVDRNNVIEFHGAKNNSSLTI